MLRLNITVDGYGNKASTVTVFLVLRLQCVKNICKILTGEMFTQENKTRTKVETTMQIIMRNVY